MLLPLEGRTTADVRYNGIGEADRRIIQREAAGRNSYRSSNVKALVWPAAYLLALCVPVSSLVSSSYCSNPLRCPFNSVTPQRGIPNRIKTRDCCRFKRTVRPRRSRCSVP